MLIFIMSSLAGSLDRKIYSFVKTYWACLISCIIKYYSGGIFFILWFKWHCIKNKCLLAICSVHSLKGWCHEIYFMYFLYHWNNVTDIWNRYLITDVCINVDVWYMKALRYLTLLLSRPPSQLILPHIVS